MYLGTCTRLTKASKEVLQEAVEGILWEQFTSRPDPGDVYAASNAVADLIEDILTENAG